MRSQIFFSLCCNNGFKKTMFAKVEVQLVKNTSIKTIILLTGTVSRDEFGF